MRRKQVPAIALVVLFLTVIACGESTPEAEISVPEQVEEPTPVPEPTDTPPTTDTSPPTDIPLPTETPRPTATLAPTNTPEPTSTLAPTGTPVSAPTSTSIPVPTATPRPAPPPTEPPAPAPAQGYGTVYLESHTSDSATCRISVWGGGNDFLLDAGSDSPHPTRYLAISMAGKSILALLAALVRPRWTYGLGARARLPAMMSTWSGGAQARTRPQRFCRTPGV